VPDPGRDRPSLHALGFERWARDGQVLEIRLSGDGEAAATGCQMCEKLLANGIIEDFRFGWRPTREVGSSPSRVE
jgi:phosphoribosylformylglycinamidine (FGAM) synthase PurS component